MFATTGPFVPAAPEWMCASVMFDAVPEAFSVYAREFELAVARNVAVPAEVTAGTSFAPLSVRLIGADAPCVGADVGGTVVAVAVGGAVVAVRVAVAVAVGLTVAEVVGVAVFVPEGVRVAVAVAEEVAVAVVVVAVAVVVVVSVACANAPSTPAPPASSPPPISAAAMPPVSQVNVPRFRCRKFASILPAQTHGIPPP